MVLMNLKEQSRTKPRRRLSAPVQISMLGFLVAGLLFPRHAQKIAAVPVEPRPLLIEEQEVVFSVLDRVHGDKLSRALVAESLAAVVDPTAKLLVTEQEQSLVFSSRFFEADGMAQETSLLKILGKLNPSAPPTGEIAILDK